MYITNILLLIKEKWVTLYIWITLPGRSNWRAKWNPCYPGIYLTFSFYWCIFSEPTTFTQSTAKVTLDSFKGTRFLVKFACMAVDLTNKELFYNCRIKFSIWIELLYRETQFYCFKSRCLVELRGNSITFIGTHFQLIKLDIGTYIALINFS